ncbi:MAG: DNRLRE domain-containing protein [Gemmataceae bacterium]|nr:DNRLRE domain-containing protein [Gemmataceae bacterium]
MPPPFHRRRARLRIDRLEERIAPAVAHFRAGDGIAQVRDTFISSSNPTQPQGSNATLEVAGPLSAGGERQALIAFDNFIGTGPGQVPANATITGATLTIWVTGGSSVSMPMSLLNVITPWTQGDATWDELGPFQLDGVTSYNFPNWNPAVTTTTTSGGYQIFGQSIGQTAYYWQAGMPNRGWAITSGDTASSWSFASSEDPIIEHRPTLTIEFTPVGGDHAPGYADLAGQPPLPTKVAWFDWADDLRERRINRVSTDRFSTYYFSQSGDDLTGRGTLDSPWKSLAKAQSILQEGAADVRFRFRRGDVWRETTVLQTSYHRNGQLTVDDYGDPLLDRPRFSRFLQLNNNWTNFGGAFAQIVPAPVGWVRESLDGYSRVYYRASSPAEVAARPFSFYCDPNGGVLLGSAMLYVNTGGDPAILPGGLEACPLNDAGWLISGNRNARLQNLVLEGQGVSADGQSYGLKISQFGDEEFVGQNLDVFYTGYHAIGHIGAGGYRNIVTLIGCRAGLCVNRGGTGAANSGDITVFVSYSGIGGNEYYQYDCTVSYGALPSSDWQAVPGMRHGTGFLSHTDGNNIGQSLILCWKTDANPCVNPVARVNLIGDPLPAATMADARAFVVEDRATWISSWWHLENTVVINSVLDLTSPPPDAATAAAAFTYGNFHAGGWIINCTVSVDAQALGASGVSLVGTFSDITQYMNCHFIVLNAAGPATFHYSWIDPTVAAAGLVITNSIFSFESSAGASAIGALNDPLHLRNNAYYFSRPITNPFLGYSNDAGKVILTQPYPAGLAPSQFSPLYNGGKDIGLEYDQRRQLRNKSKAIGPLAGVEAPNPTRLDVLSGIQSATLGADTVISTSTANRMTLQFPVPVDVGAGSLAVWGPNGRVPVSQYSASLGRQSHTWQFSSPLSRGRYSIEWNGNPIGTFRVLPGDFNGDGIVDAGDFVQLRLNFLSNSAVCDIDGDGVVSTTDFLTFRSNFLLSVI